MMTKTIAFIHTPIVQFILYQAIKKSFLNKGFISHSKQSGALNLINLKQSILIEIKILS